ncbi:MULTISPECIES: hypothetical protein [Prauserella salsuginis group]|uniref:Uncharacterized protein n=2 Tax=Prauserella salsuginis group TaxID=2893672 RepID=A0A839XHA0_9PSEU|nr:MULTISPECIES: hypothetical protein [Prauserella salsuginis group]MBB3661099.1 hypothetical protein [Prauserella sediminis]MCR3718964.1 hypothetical protein [Prauserella flava]MCR3733534.1 hypothetical protein [Prauserella salsuginis]
MTEKQTPRPAQRWTVRGLAVSALAVPMLAVLGGTASAAELTPIAEYLDETIATTSASLVEALALLLGVR